MADHQHATGELEQGILEGAQGLYVKVVGGFVQQQHVAALHERFGQVQAPAFPAGEGSHRLLLVCALEVEAANVGAGWHLESANLQHIAPLSEQVEHGFLAVEVVPALVDVGHLDSRPNHHTAGVGLLLAGDHAEQCRFAGAVRADDADDGPGRHREAQIVDEQAVAERLGHTVELDDFVAQALRDGNKDFVGFVALLVVLRVEFLEAGQARFGFCLPPFGVLAHPLEFFGDGLLSSGF